MARILKSSGPGRQGLAARAGYSSHRSPSDRATGPEGLLFQGWGSHERRPVGEATVPACGAPKGEM